MSEERRKSAMKEGSYSERKLGKGLHTKALTPRITGREDKRKELEEMLRRIAERQQRGGRA